MPLCPICKALADSKKRLEESGAMIDFVHEEDVELIPLIGIVDEELFVSLECPQCGIVFPPSAQEEEKIIEKLGGEEKIMLKLMKASKEAEG